MGVERARAAAGLRRGVFSARCDEAAEAAVAGQQVLVLAQWLLGSDSRLAHNAMRHTVAHLERAGRTDEAIILLRSALSRRPGRTAVARLRRRQSAFALGALLSKVGRDEEAEAHLTHVVATAPPGSGEPSQSLTWSAMSWLADVLSRSRRFEEAQTLLERVVAGLWRRDGADAATTLDAELALAAAIAGQGAYEEALPLYRRVAETRGQHPGVDEALLARWHLAACLHLAHQDPEARVVAGGLLEAKRGLLGDGHGEVVAVAALVADIDRALAR